MKLFIVTRLHTQAYLGKMVNGVSSKVFVKTVRQFNKYQVRACSGGIPPCKNKLLSYDVGDSEVLNDFIDEINNITSTENKVISYIKRLVSNKVGKLVKFDKNIARKSDMSLKISTNNYTSPLKYFITVIDNITEFNYHVNYESLDCYKILKLEGELTNDSGSIVELTEEESSILRSLINRKFIDRRDFITENFFRLISQVQGKDSTYTFKL